MYIYTHYNDMMHAFSAWTPAHQSLLKHRQRLDQAAICADRQWRGTGRDTMQKLWVWERIRTQYGYDNNNDILRMPSIHRIS